jgi:hypothetical protein
MKIISKYKDYYDYLQGIYGVDEKLVLDRRVDYNPASYSTYNGVHVLFICGKVLEFICIKDKFYFGDDMAQFSEEIPNSKWWWNIKNIKPTYLINCTNTRGAWNYNQIFYPHLSEDVHGLYKEVKELSKECPIFLYNPIRRDIQMEYPKLDELGINKMIPAHDMWIMLTEWLGQRITRNEPQQPIGDDKVRLVSAGFDLKTSFRH